MSDAAAVPSPESLLWPAVLALRELGGYASHQELLGKVVALEAIPESAQKVMHSPATNWTKLSFNLGKVVRTTLGKAGILDVSRERKGQWVLTEKGRIVTDRDVQRIPEELPKAKKSATRSETNAVDDDLQPDAKWKTTLMAALTSMPPDAFERLAQRLLRSSGFSTVEVTGKTGDGGIDGIGVLRVQEWLSFHVYFQCKRYKGSAISGRTDKGLFITTGTFTADARKEATRDGVPPIDLVDGDRLCDLLRDHKLGVATELVVDAEWFLKL